MAWIVGIHDEARFKIIAICESEDDAKQTAEALLSMGRAFYWEATEVIS